MREKSILFICRAGLAAIALNSSLTGGYFYLKGKNGRKKVGKRKSLSNNTHYDQDMHRVISINEISRWFRASNHAIVWPTLPYMVMCTPNRHMYARKASAAAGRKWRPLHAVVAAI
jgi:hypothetical protein